MKSQKLSIVITIVAAIMLCAGASFAGSADYDYIYGLIEQNKLDEAEFALTAVVAADGRDVVALSLLGDTYRRRCDKSRALKFLQRARYAIEYMRANPDPRVEPDGSFLEQEYRY